MHHAVNDKITVLTAHRESKPPRVNDERQRVHTKAIVAKVWDLASAK